MVVRLTFPGRFSVINCLLWLTIVTTAGCGGTEESTEEKVARVYDRYLYTSDLAGIVPSGTSAADSIEMISEYISNWTQEQVILHQADLNLTEEQKDVEKQLEDYRNSLMIFAYESALVQQRLDTSVSRREIEAYYNENPEHFLLRDYIVKVLYVKLDTANEDKRKVNKWYKLRKEEDLGELLAFSQAYAVNHYYDDQSWLYFDDLTREIPLRVYNKEEFLQKNKYVSFENGGYLYFLHILDYRLKDNVSPIDLEVHNIRNEIINQRKSKLITDMRNTLYNDALDRQHVERYELP